MKPGLKGAVRRDGLAKLIASFFYLGYLPLAPGTMGAAGGMCVYLLLRWLAPGFIPDTVGGLGPGYAIFLTVFFLAGVYFSGRGELAWRKRDAPFIVVDEAFSFFITMFWIPFSAIAVVVGFALNRIFDIIKPFPARRLEMISGGWGVMLDDVVAGVYSNLVLRAILFLLNHWR